MQPLTKLIIFKNISFDKSKFESKFAKGISASEAHLETGALFLAHLLQPRVAFRRVHWTRYAVTAFVLILVVRLLAV